MNVKKFILSVAVVVASVFCSAQTATYDPSVFIDIDINSGNPTYPFPQFLEYKGGKSLAKYNAEGVTHADMEKAMREAYEIMMHRCRYEGNYCGVDYISFNRDDVAGNYGTFVSEGDGYALLAAAIFADQKTFNGLYMWVHDIRFSGVKRFRDGNTRGLTANDYGGPYLAAWKDKTFDAAYGSDSHSATDGDVDIAMAMLIAYKQWGEWMMQDGAVVKDSEGNPISLKYEAQRVVGALVDTIPQYDKGSGAMTGYLCGDVGIDGYEKRGNSWGELTRWRFTTEGQAAYPGANGPYNGGPNLMSIYGGNYIDYDAPSYFEEFWRWLKNGDGTDANNSALAPWEIHQFKRAAASGNWLNKQAYDQGLYASIGNVSVGDYGASPTFGVYVDGEDFRYAWRHVLDYLWHGDADYDWDPQTHQVIEGQTNNSERLMGVRHATLLENPSNAGTQICAKMGASPDPGQPLWYGVAQIPQQWTPTGGITSAYHTNYSVGAGATAAVASENLSLIADIYRQCEIMWDGNNTASKLDEEERYIGSTPKYFHGWFRTLGMLVCSGNLRAPEEMKPTANMKVYMSVDKTYAYEGDKVGYTVQYRNYGSLDATGVTIQTPLDEDYTFVSATKGGVYDKATHTITWNIGTVPGFKSGQLAKTIDSVAFTVQITSLANSRVCETSTISGTNFDEWVSNEYPNHATYTMERNCVDVLANRSLVVDKSANRTELNPNDNVTFTVNFENVSTADSWMNGGRDNVRISYGNYYMNGNAYQFYHLYRFWNDSYEAYINMNNYRVSYFMYDAAAQGLYDATTNTTGWTFVVDNQNDLDKYGYNPETGPITFAYQKIPQGEDEYGKWNQRLMIRFADVLMAPSTHVYDKLDSQYLLHKGVWGPGFIRARLASNPASDLTSRVADDWSFSTDITAGTIDGQGETFTLITPCWANYTNLGYEVDNYSRHTCSSPISKLTNFDRVLVEEFDGYTWRRIQGRGPLPGKEAYNVTIVDTIPKELTFDAFVTKKALGIEATYTAAPAGASYSGIVKWTIPEMLVGEKGKLVYTCTANDIGCPDAEDAYYVNAAWIYSDTDSPDSSAVSLMTSCTELPPFIEPQNSLFKTASATTASVGDELTYEVKYVNTTGTIVDEDCSSNTNWMALGGKTLPSSSGSTLPLSTNGSSAYFYGPKYSYGADGSVYLTFGNLTGSTTQELYFVMRYESGIPGASDFKGIAMKMLINVDGANHFGYYLYNNGTCVKYEGTSWSDAIAYPGSSSAPVFKFVLNDDHLYLYINDADNEWTSVVKDWSGLKTTPGYFGLYVNSNGNSSTSIDNFRTELDYAFDVTLSDELPDELTNITNISGSGTYSAGTKKITWPTVAGPLAPNDEISYTFDATVYSCNAYINNYAVASVYGQDDIKVVNSVKCGATLCPDPPTASPIAGCVGEEVTLTATKTGSNTLIWYESDKKTKLTSTKITKTTAGTYTYYVSQKGSCESDLTEVTVTINETAVPTVSDVSYCKNQTGVTALTATGTSITWYNDSKIELSDAPTPDVTTEGTTTYFVTDTENGCESDYAQIDVTVGALAKPTVDATVSYCQGETATALTATATGTNTLKWYESKTATTALATAPTPVTTKVSTGTSYFVSQATDACESERAEISVVVKARPTATIEATADSYCGETSTIKLTLDSDVDLTDATYAWEKDATASATTASVSNATEGEYTCTITLDGCDYTTDAKTITQNDNPTYTIMGEGSYCPESTSKDPIVITFTAGTAPFSFTENVTGKATSDQTTYSIADPQGGTYKLTALTDANGCEMTATAPSVEVVDLETPELTIASIAGVCAGTASVDISKSVTAGTGTLTYSTDKGTISNAGLLTDLTTAGEYTVTVKLTGTAAPYCENTKTATLTVFENPDVALDATYSVCSETDLELTPTITGTSTYAYTWSEDGSAKLNSMTLEKPTFNATVSADTDYDLKLTVTDKTTSCSSEVTTQVTTYALPTATLSADETFVCADADLAITATVSDIGTGKGTWTNATKNNETSATINGGDYAAGTNTVSYEYTDAHNCTSKPATKDITIVAKPDKPQATNFSYCLNATVSSPLQITGITNPKWYDAKGTELTTAPTPSTTTVGTTTYSVSQIVDGCESEKADVTVTVKDKLTPEIVVSSASVCEGEAVQVSLSQGFKTQIWSGTATANMNSTSMAAPTFLETAAAGSYELTVTVTDENGCSGTSDATTIIVNPIPTATITSTETEFCISQTTAQNVLATHEPATVTGSFTWTGVPTTATLSFADFVPSDNTIGDNEITYQFVSDAGCKSNVASLTMTVYDLPTISITPSVTDICKSGNNSSDITISASQKTGTFAYSVDKGTIGTDGTFSATNGVGDYTISLLYTDEHSCQNTAQTEVHIHALPEIEFASTNPTELCYNGSSISLSVSPSPSTTSYSFVGTTDPTSSEFNPATAAIGTNTITYNYTDSYGCQNSESYDIEVVKVLAPTVDAPNPRTVTIDDTNTLLDVTTMTATANNASDVVVWKDATTTVATGASFTSAETTAGQYEYSVQEYRMINGQECYSEAVTATLVLSNCTAKSPIVTNQKLCVGDNENVTLEATYAGSTTDKQIAWFSDKALTDKLFDGTSYATTISTVAAAITTFYVAEYDVAKDCWSVPTPFTVTVNALPELKINAIDYLCYADGTYSATGTINGVASTAGTWSAKDNAFTVNATTGVIDTKSAGEKDGAYTITYTYTDDNSCKNSVDEDFYIEYPNKPSSNGYLGIVSKPLTVEVSAETTSLEASYSEVHWYQSASATTFETGVTWQPGDDPATEHTTTYYLTQVVNGCESEKAEALVQIVSCPFEQPVVTNVVACKNDATLQDLQASLPATTTVAADKWIWYDATKTELSSGTSNSYVSGVSTATADVTTFYVGYLATEPTTTEQCPSPLAAITVTINDLPTVEIVNPNKALCYDDGDVQISAKVNGTTNLTGTWTLTGEASGITSTGVFNTQFKGEVDGNYELTYSFTDGNTCVNSDVITLQVEYPEIPSADNYLGLTSKPDPIVLTAKDIETAGTPNWYASNVVKSNDVNWTTPDDPTKAHDSNYQLSQTINGCESEKANVLVSISDCPFAAPTPTNVEICQGEINVSDISASTTTTAESWIWYDANKQELSRGASNSYATNISTATAGTTSFYVSYLATDTKSGIQCESPVAEVMVTVNPLPTITFDSDNATAVCYDQGDVLWTKSVDYHQNGIGSGTWKVDGEENNGINATGVFNPTTFGETTGTYEISYTYTDGKNCTNTLAQNIDVQFTPMPTVTGHASLVEQNATVTVSATGTDNSATISWYNESGKLVSTNNPFETGDAGDEVQNKSYFATQTINGCESEKAEAKVSVIYCPVPKPVVIQPADICNYDDAPELTASLGDWSSRPTGTGAVVFNFYDEENATTPISSDLDGTFTPNIDKTKAATYTYWVAEYNENVSPAACEGKRAKITLNVRQTAKPSISSSIDAVCQYETNPTFTGVGQGTIQWYEAEPEYPAMNPDAEGKTFVPDNAEVGVHEVWATQLNDGCVSEAVSKSYEIKVIPEAPQTTNGTSCEASEKMQLCATPDAGGTITWYSNINATGQIAKTTCYTPSVSAAGTYTYYATQTVQGCQSETRATTYVISPLPATPIIVTSASSCDYDTEHLLSVNVSDDVEVSWYTTNDSTSLISTGKTLTHTITNAGTQRYYARLRQDGCLGYPTMASFVIVESPTMPQVTNDKVCYDEDATLSTSGMKDLWYSDESLETFVSQGNSISIPNVTENVTYYVVREKSGCRSEVAKATVEVIEQPTITISYQDEEATIIQRCEYDEEFPLVATISPTLGDDDYVEWSIFPGNKTIHGNETLLLSDVVTLSSATTTSTNYTIRATYLIKNEQNGKYCSSVEDTIKMMTNAKARKPIVLSRVICQGEEIEPLQAFGTPNITWISVDGILPIITQGQRYEFSKQQGEIPVGTYQFIVFDENSETGCHSDSLTVEMTVAPAAQTKIFGADSVCIGSTEEYYTQYCDNSTYFWSVTGGNLNYSKDAMSSSVRYVDWVNAGIDTLVVFEQTWAGCQGADTLVVKTANKPRALFGWSLPGESNVIELRDSTMQDSIVEIMPNGERYAEEIPYTLYWNYGHSGSSSDEIDLEVPFAQRNYPITEGDYVYGYNCPTLTVENSFGCSDSYNECVFINITSGLYIPSAFSPTNPAHSVRYFQPKGYNLKTCEVSVYDKWGNLVWYNDEVQDGMFVGKWDGCVNGKMMSADTYIWKIEATFIDGQIWEGLPLKNGKKTKYGNVSLIR